MLFLKVGKVWDSSLTPLTDEEMLCFAFLGYQTGFYPLHSKVVLKLKDLILLSEAETQQYKRGLDGVASRTNRDSYVTSAVKTLPYQAYLPGIDLGFVLLRCVVEWGLQVSANDCLVIPIPQPRLELMCKGAWFTIPCLGRCAE